MKNLCHLVSVCLLVVGLINVAPVIGIVSSMKLESAYGIALSSNDLVILMRHRALLFGLLGGFILFSVFSPRYQNAAITMAAVSMIGFAVLAHSVGDFNASMQNVLIADYVGVVILMVVVILKFAGGRGVKK